MIEISALTKRYGTTSVLDDVSLRVERGEVLAVVGPSGAGKSTLARCINLLEAPTSGTISVDGVDLTRLGRRDLRVARRSIGTVFQSAGLLRQLTAAQNVALPLRNAGVPLAEQQRRVHELLERVDMLHRASHYPAQLSGGQQQRIGLARGLALQPSVLLADEPTSGLDPEATDSIVDLLAELRADLGVTVVLITHEMDVVRRIADRVARLDQGRIVEEGPIGDLVLQPNSSLAHALVPAPPPARRPVGAETYALQYVRADVPATWPGIVGRALGVDIALVAGLVEQVDGHDAARLTAGVDRDVAPRRVIEAFAEVGIAARHLAPNTPPSEPAPPGQTPGPARELAEVTA